MFNFNFWHRWLLTVSFLLIIFGLSLALFSQTPLFNVLFNDAINKVFWGEEPLSKPALLYQQWIYCISGAVIVGWSTMMVFVVTHAFRNKEYWAWQCLVFSILSWFVIDTTFSFYFHVYINIVIDCITFIVFALPLIFTKKYFHS